MSFTNPSHPPAHPSSKSFGKAFLTVVFRLLGVVERRKRNAGPSLLSICSIGAGGDEVVSSATPGIGDVEREEMT